MQIRRTNNRRRGTRSNRLALTLLAALIVAVAGTVAAMSTGASADTFSALARPTFPASPFTIHGFGGKCVDVPNGLFNDGAPLQMWDCNRTPAQVFRVGPNDSLMVGDKCLDIPWGSKDWGTRVQLARCNGGPAQVWLPTHWGGIRNPHAGVCLDVAGWGTANGTASITWGCFNQENQRFWH